MRWAQTKEVEVKMEKTWIIEKCGSGNWQNNVWMDMEIERSQEIKDNSYIWRLGNWMDVHSPNQKPSV